MDGAKKLGNAGEKAAKSFLLQHGYKILTTNYTALAGEIDIVAIETGDLVFIEVKTRRSFRCGLPRQAVNQTKKRKIIQTARCFLYTHQEYEDYNCRFDVVEVYPAAGSQQINIIKNAFEVS